MGSVYRRQVRFCTRCDQRLDTTAARHACEAAGHAIAIRERPIWWIKYQVGGRPAVRQLREQQEEGRRRSAQRARRRGGPGPAEHREGRQVRFDEAADDYLNEYRTNRRRSLETVKGRIENHLKPYFGGRRLTTIGTADVRMFVMRRQAEGAANGSINRDLAVLKRIYTLAVQAGKLMTRPYIPMLRENNVRKGFFEPEQFKSVRNHLPLHMRPIVEFACVTGWRTPSEILPLEWRQVDMTLGEVRLDVGTTKNDQGRVFPFTLELRRVLEAQEKAADALKTAGIITPFVFFYTFGQKAGKRITESGFHKAWRKARVDAGCPGRIPHDFRRTAVRNLVRAGVPERVAMQLTGHKTRAVFERYNIVSAGDLLDAVRRLNTYASKTAS